MSEPDSRQPRTEAPTFLQKVMSWRGAISLLLHLNFTLVIVLSQNMAFALVCMLKTPAVYSLSTLPPRGSSEDNGTSTAAAGWSEAVEDIEQLNSTAEASEGEFSWGSSTQGLVLSSSFMLSFLSPALTDLVSRRLGSHRMLLVSMVLMAVLSFLQPAGARLSPYVLVALRISIGVIVGMQIPLMMDVMPWWAPDREKVTMVSFVFAAPNTGAIVVSLTSGFLCSIPWDHGWPFIFYMQGSLAVLWSILWLLTGSDKPENHPYISEDEKQYIIKTRHAMGKNQKRSSPPYRKILSCVPLWGSVIMQTVHLNCAGVLMVYTPLFFSTVLRFSLPQIGLISALIYVARFVGVLGWGQISNLLLRKTPLNTTACRKLIQCSSYYLCGACLVALGFVWHQGVVLCLLFLVFVSQSSTSSAAVIIPLDIAPRYSAFLNGLIMMIAMAACVPGPLLTSFMIKNGSRGEWRNVFLTLAAIAAVGATCFLFMASSKLQSWAKPEDKDDSQNESPDLKEQTPDILSE